MSDVRVHPNVCPSLSVADGQTVCPSIFHPKAYPLPTEKILSIERLVFWCPFAQMVVQKYEFFRFWIFHILLAVVFSLIVHPKACPKIRIFPFLNIPYFMYFFFFFLQYPMSILISVGLITSAYIGKFLHISNLRFSSIFFSNCFILSMYEASWGDGWNDMSMSIGFTR